MMDVSMDPRALGNSATGFARIAEGLAGDTASIADLSELRAAFGVAGAQAWQAVEARLTELQRQLETARQSATQTGSALSSTADGATTIDHNNGRSMTVNP